ncbi:hypothetical protein [Clostridium sp. JS66]|uniref:hypothetical protein n=1 Tax=Clostridium sp. JS66 TaxID=3064705 RepID=UPI00298EA4A7|nr:hypothetical protein [Clostridium sp. JS66]WPC44139.1 hypothetical protein Q6H37_11870 [Clostridium sp. JS66]
MKNFKSYLKLLFSMLFLIIILFSNESICVKANNTQELDLKNIIIPLKTTEAGNGFEDLDKLQEMLKDKKVLAM